MPLKQRAGAGSFRRRGSENAIHVQRVWNLVLRETADSPAQGSMRPLQPCGRTRVVRYHPLLGGGFRSGSAVGPEAHSGVMSQLSEASSSGSQEMGNYKGRR